MNEEKLSQNYKAACALMNIALGEGTELERLKAMELFLDDIRPEPYELAKCDVLWCEENTVSGGNAWRETGYWSVCSDHANSARQGQSQPIMKQSAIDRENSRLPDGTLPTIFF